MKNEKKKPFMRPFLTCSEIADILKCSTRAVQKIVQRGELTVLEIADGANSRHRSFRIDPYSFERWVAARMHRVERDALAVADVVAE